MKVVVVGEAENDVLDAALRYESFRVGLGDGFLDEIARVYSRLASDKKFVVAPFRRYRKRVIRRLFVRRFPYRVFFVDGTDVRIVVAVAHDRRRAYWLKRVPQP